MLLPSLSKGMCFADPITSHCVAPLNSGLRAITSVVSSSIPVSSFSTISQEDPTSAKSVGLQALVEKNDVAASQFELSNYTDLQQSPYMSLRQYSHSLSLTCGPIFEAPASATPSIHHHTCTSFYPSLSTASRAHPSVRCVLEHSRRACNLSDVPSFWWPQERPALFGAVALESSAKEVLLYDVESCKLEQRLSDSSITAPGCASMHFSPDEFHNALQ